MYLDEEEVNRMDYKARKNVVPMWIVLGSFLAISILVILALFIVSKRRKKGDNEE